MKKKNYLTPDVKVRRVGAPRILAGSTGASTEGLSSGSSVFDDKESGNAKEGSVGVGFIEP